jgi:hypothetical protein
MASLDSTFSLKKADVKFDVQGSDTTMTRKVIKLIPQKLLRIEAIYSMNAFQHF